MSSSCAAALLQDIETKSGPRDSWGNPKIPRLDMLSHSAPDENGWYGVTQPTTMESFSSLFGLPLLGVPDRGTVEFGIESAYVQLDTFSVEFIDQDPLQANGPWELRIKCPTCISTVGDLFDRGVYQGRADQLIGSPWIQPNSTQLSQESYTNAHIIRLEQSHFSTNLSALITQVLVETQVVCEDGIYKATKVRPSTTDHRPQNMTAFDVWGVLSLDILNQTNGQNGWNSPTMLELFMNKTSAIPLSRGDFMTGPSDWFYTNLARSEPKILSNRATILLNTAIHLLYSYYGFAGALPSAEIIDWGPAHVPADGLYAAAAAYNSTPGRLLDDAEGYVGNVVAGDAAFVAASTEASVKRNTIIYKADYAYVTVLVTSSLALIIIGLVGIVMGLRTRAPDVFDPLMGLTYNTGAMGLPNPGSTLDTNTRAKLLRGMRVRLGDIAGGEPVGQVGVGRVSEVVSLAQGRLYE